MKRQGRYLKDFTQFAQQKHIPQHVWSIDWHVASTFKNIVQPLYNIDEQIVIGGPTLRKAWTL